MHTTFETDLGDSALLDLATARGGRTIFVRQVPRRAVTHPSGAVYKAPFGAGEIVALDGALSEIERIDVEALVVAHGLDALQTRALRTVHDPRGWAFAILCRDRLAEFGFGVDDEGRSRSGESWSSYTCERAKLFSSAAYHPTNGDLVFVEEGGAVRTAHAHLNWPGVAAYGAAIDDARVAAIGPKDLCVYDRAAGAEAFRSALGPGYSVCLLPEGRVAVLGGKKARLRVLDAAGGWVLGLEAQVPLTARLEASPSGVLALVTPERVAFVDPATGRVATLPNYTSGADTRAGQFAWLDANRAAVVSPGTARLSVVDLGDIFGTLPAAKWKIEKPK